MPRTYWGRRIANAFFKWRSSCSCRRKFVREASVVLILFARSTARGNYCGQGRFKAAPAYTMTAPTARPRAADARYLFVMRSQPLFALLRFVRRGPLSTAEKISDCSGGTRYRCGLVVGLLAMTAATATAASAAPPRWLPDCLGKPRVQPRSVTLACADGNFGVERVTWLGWGTLRAVGIGTAYANDCLPSCVDGHTHRYPAVLILTGQQRCASGQIAYRTITYAFVGRSPFPTDAPGTLDPRQTTSCA
jgi:hypothetical protein